MNESDAQKIIYRDFAKQKRHVLAVPNCKALYPRGESDLISVTEAGLVHEFEIKTSKSDFERDFRDKSFKHEVLEEQAPTEGKCTPNYFWFAMPRNVCKEVEVPEYAGKMCVSSSGCEVRKDASRRHSDHITDRARKYLERGVTVRYWDA
jgi:hypothetical protein